MPGGGGGGDTTTVQKSDPWEGQQPYLKDIYSQAQNLYNNFGQQYFPESGVAGLSPWTEGGVGGLAAFGNSPYYMQGAQAALNSQNTFTQAQSPWTNPFMGIGYGQAGGVNNYLSQTLSGQNQVGYDPAAAGSVLQNYQQMQGPMSGNPYLDQAVDAAQKRTAQNFNEQVMPQISMSSLANNAFGGSRQGIAEGLAADRLQQQMGDIATQMYTGAYESGQNRALQGAGQQAGLSTNVNMQNANQNLAAQLANQQLQQYAVGQGMGALQGGIGMGLDAARIQQATLPSYAQYGMLPTQNLLQAGNIDQQYRQQVLDDEIARWNFYQQQPWWQMQQYAGIAQPGSGGGTTTATGPGSSTSPLVGGLGGAATGLGIYSGLTSSIGGAAPLMAANPWLAAAIIGGGALAGGLSN